MTKGPTLLRVLMSLALLATTLVATAVQARADDVAVRGAATCQAFLDAKRNSVEEALKDLTWFLGYMSGLAVANHVDVLGAGNSAQSVVTWVDTYCQRYPENDLSDAGNLYYKFRIEQMKTSKDGSLKGIGK